MKPSDNSANQLTEDDLFASMAKVRQPLAPDSPQTLPDLSSSPDSASSQRARVKAMYPGLTESDLDELMM